MRCSCWLTSASAARIVECLRADTHDVIWVTETQPGKADPDVLQWSWRESRILITADWGFGELAIRLKQPAFGIVILAISQFAPDPAGVADTLAEHLTDLDDRLLGKLTIVGPRRVRQRDLPHSAQG